MAVKEIKDLTGLSKAEPKEREAVAKDLLTTLLELSDDKTSVESSVPVEIKRGGEVKLTFRIHQISDEDVRAAQRKSTKYKANPNGKKLPQIEWDRDPVKYRSLVIYAATIPEDQKKVWGLQAFMDKKNCIEPYETIDHILNLGEKMTVFSKILEISGLNDDDEEEATLEEYAKN